MTAKREPWYNRIFKTPCLEDEWNLLKAVDTADSAQCRSNWEQAILSQAQYLWPTSKLEIEYTKLVHTKHSTPDAQATFYGRLVWKKELDAPHNAYLTLRGVHINVPEKYALQIRTHAIHIALLSALHEWVVARLKKKLGKNWEKVLIEEWSKGGAACPPAYKE